MPIRVFSSKDRSVYAEVDSLEEAVELMTMASRVCRPSSSAADRRLSHETSGRDEDQNFRATLKFLGKSIVAFLEALNKHRGGATGSVLAQESNKRPGTIGAIVSNITKAARKYNLTKEDFLFSEVRRNEETHTRERLFFPGKLLQKHDGDLRF